jgi:hypothetical protein
MAAEQRPATETRLRAVALIQQPLVSLRSTVLNPSAIDEHTGLSTQFVTIHLAAAAKEARETTAERRSCNRACGRRLMEQHKSTVV